MKKYTAKEIAEYLATSGTEFEWEEADGESFEAVLFKAAEALGVEII